MEMNERLKHNLQQWYNYFRTAHNLPILESLQSAIQMQKNELICKGLFVDDPNEKIDSFGSPQIHVLTEELSFMREEIDKNLKKINLDQHDS